MEAFQEGLFFCVDLYNRSSTGTFSALALRTSWFLEDLQGSTDAESLSGRITVTAKYKTQHIN